MATRASAAPLTPISAVNRALRGRGPTASLDKCIRSVFHLRADATPHVVRRFEDLVRSTMSPEPGTLGREELEAVVDKLEQRRSARLLKKQIQEERAAMELAEAEADRFKENQLRGGRAAAKRKEYLEVAEAAGNTPVPRLQRDNLGRGI